MKLLGSYTNGNYQVSIFDDGTKIRENDLDFLSPTFPESMDIKITNQCECGCPYCHENSTVDGEHGDILGARFINSLHPYTELAIGGGNPLSHPNLVEFLEKCKQLKLVPSMTVNQKHFLESFDLIKSLVDRGLVYGVGVSLTEVTPELIEKLKLVPNAVLHIINGVVDIKNLALLYNQNFKILILGYKEFRRGKTYYSAAVEEKKAEMYHALPDIVNRFKVVSFDNLAIKQLDTQRLLSKEQWDEFYMGDDGQFTMYVDMVKGEFAKGSTSTERWPIMDDIVPMFNVVRNVGVE